MDDNIEDMTRIFFKLHICAVCERYYTEIDNVGAHTCRYHPGEYDSFNDMYTCCSEQRRYGSTDYHRYMSFTPDKPHAYLDFSKGCTPCDCRSIFDNPLPYEDVDVKHYAPMLIFMKDVASRDGYNEKKLKLERMKRPKDVQTISS